MLRPSERWSDARAMLTELELAQYIPNFEVLLIYM